MTGSCHNTTQIIFDSKPGGKKKIAIANPINSRNNTNLAMLIDDNFNDSKKTEKKKGSDKDEKQ